MCSAPIVTCKFKKMIPIHLPSFDIKVTREDGRTRIFDFLRRRYVALTPEEWVRQHFTHYLVEHLGYPATLMGNEVMVRIGGVARRCDTVLYARTGGTPRMIIEYKAPEVAITERVFQQISAYNSALRVPYLIVSNGIRHYCMHIDYATQRVEYLPEIPRHEELR